jgi:hypothetical protein
MQNLWGEKRGVCGRCRKRRENITINLRETDCEDLKWFQLAQPRVHWSASLNTVQNKVLDLWIPGTGYSELIAGSR